MSAARLSVSLAALAFASGCALFQPPLTPAERLASDVQRVALAPTDSARTALVLDLVRASGLTPVAGREYTYGASPVVAGFAPGRTPLARDTLVIVAAAIDGPHAVALVAAGARLADASARRGADPGRSVLVALWPARTDPAQGVTDVLAFPLWPRGAVRRVLVVGAEARTRDPRVASVPSSSPEGIAARLLDVASADLFTVSSDTLRTD